MIMGLFEKILSDWNIEITVRQSDQFDRYFELLVFWNEKINLTSITGKDDVFVKHFADSIAMLKYADMSGKSLIDIGTGAGFPGIPLKIMCPELNVVLADSLNKRITFLNEIINELELDDIIAIHGRAEDLANDNEYREKFDVVTSRAVANLSVLSEYCLPFVNTGGTFISYKSGNVDDELSSAGHAIEVLGGKVERVEKYSIPYTDYDRSLCFIKKINATDKKYPRKAGTALKKPL